MHFATASDWVDLHEPHRGPDEPDELCEFCESRLLTRPLLKSSQIAESLTGGDEPLNVNGESDK